MLFAGKGPREQQQQKVLLMLFNYLQRPAGPLGIIWNKRLNDYRGLRRP